MDYPGCSTSMDVELWLDELMDRILSWLYPRASDLSQSKDRAIA